jgi:transcriptional regulator with XRE-family HTH domain
MTVGERLREARRARGLTQQRLAEESGLNAITISEIERGANTTVQTLQRLAIALRVQVGSLFEEMSLEHMERVADYMRRHM